jgi:AhpD family alkylhydroperoxidase
MPAFGYIEYDQASPRVRAVYDDIMATRKVDWISNFWKSIAHDPNLLERTWSSLKQVMGPSETLNSLTKELLYLAVSASNQCEYCIASHTAAAWKAGMNGAIFAEIMSIVGMANETNKLVSAYQVEVDDRFQKGAVGWQDFPSPAEVVHQYLNAIHCFDEACIRNILDPEVVAYDGSERVRYEFISAYFGQIAAGVKDFRITPETVIPSGEWVSIVNTTSGIHIGTLFGVPATNRKFQVRGMAMFRVVKGKIVEIHSQWDMGDLLRQLTKENAAPLRAPQMDTPIQTS